MRIKPEDRKWLLAYRLRDKLYCKGLPWYRRWFSALLWRLMFLAPFGVRVIYDAGVPYLIRGHWTPTRWFVPRLYLHYFAKSDQDHDLHNHPMNGLSIILTGGYREERLLSWAKEAHERKLLEKQIKIVETWSPRPDKTYTQDRKPFCPFTITRDTFHRVELVKGRCWTLFITGKRVGPSDGTDWGFINLATGKYTPWGEYKMDPQNARPGKKEEAAE